MYSFPQLQEKQVGAVKSGPAVTLDDIMSVKLKSAGERKDKDLNVRRMWVWLVVVGRGLICVLPAA